MLQPALLNKVNYIGECKLNGRSEFIGRLHKKLTWGWVLWTKDGYDVITLSEAHRELFDVKSGDWVIVYQNKLWVPHTAYKDINAGLLYSKFKIGSELYHMLTIDDPKSKESNYTSMSAVYAHTVLENDIRPIMALRQRKAWKRWVENQPVRARIALSEFTSARTEQLSRFVESVHKLGLTEYLILPYSTYGQMEIQIRLLFAHLTDNQVFQYLWNKHQFCGLKYRILNESVAALYSDDFCITSLGRGMGSTREFEQWFATQNPLDVLGFVPQREIMCCVSSGIIDETTNVIYTQ